MLVKHMPCTLGYIMRPDGRVPTVIWGVPSVVQATIEQLKIGKDIPDSRLSRYEATCETSGVISLDPDESKRLLLDPTKEKALISDFLQHYAPGIELRHLPLCIVRHLEYPKDKDTGLPILDDEPRVAYHFHAANQHLGSGKKLELYYGHGPDRKRIEALQDWLSAKHGFTSANWVKRPSSVPQRSNRRDLIDTIEQKLMQRFADGKITTRAHTIRELESMGYPLSRRADGYIAVRVGDKNVRLKGGLYEIGGPERMRAAGITAPGQTMTLPHPPLEELAKRLEERSARKASYNLRRYGGLTPREAFNRAAPKDRREAVERLEKRARDPRPLGKPERQKAERLFGPQGLRALCGNRDERHIANVFQKMRDEEWRGVMELCDVLRKQRQSSLAERLYYADQRITRHAARATTSNNQSHDNTISIDR